MSILSEIMTEELDRNIRMQKAYEKELQTLPCGSVIVREINGHHYVSLTYREHGKVINKNIGPRHKVNIEELKSKVLQAKEYKTSLKELKKEELALRKIIKELSIT